MAMPIPEDVIGQEVGTWRIVGCENPDVTHGERKYQIACTSCDEVITSRWGRFGEKQPRLCTCHPDYAGRGRPAKDKTVAERPAPEVSAELLARIKKPWVDKTKAPKMPSSAAAFGGRPRRQRKRATVDLMQEPKFPYRSLMNGRLAAIRARAELKGIEFALTIEFLERLYIHQDGRCAVSGLPITLHGERSNASLDRKDSDYGYVPGNVQWTDKTINLMKLDTDSEEFVELCEAVVSHNRTYPNFLSEIGIDEAA
jgi:hypothetical protein